MSKKSRKNEKKGDENEEEFKQSPSVASFNAATVGPKADLLGSGIGTMKARKMNSPSVVDSQDSKFVLSDFK